MEGKQQTAYEQLMNFASSIRDGKYGTGDAIDATRLLEDMDETRVALEMYIC